MKYNRNTSLKLVLLALVVVAEACTKKQEVVQAPPPEIQVVNVIQQDIPLYQDFVGQVYGLTDITIRARVEGYLEGIHFAEGLPVKKGQLLYTVDSQPYRAEVAAQQGKVAEAQTRLVNAENELARYKPLAEINAVSKSDLDAAQASRDAAKASLDAAKANLQMAKINLGYCSITSPINGLIGKSEAEVGEFVGRYPNPVILNTVSNIEETKVQFFITEAEYLILAQQVLSEKKEASDRMRKAEEGREIELILADGSTFNQKGTYDFIDRNVDSSTGSILVQVTFPNPDGILRPGMFARVRAKMKTVENAHLVPQRCVMEIQGQYSVYVVESGNIVKARTIKATQKIGDLWLIEEGLSASDKIVIDGLQKVKSGLEVSPTTIAFKSQTNQ